jgi:tRNA G10  N-methylase Trm11
MVRLAEIRAGQTILDPMCGAGTILAETLVAMEHSRIRAQVCGGDIGRQAVRTAAANLRRLGQPLLCRWDATRLPLPDASIDRIISNPPFGKQIDRPEEIGTLYARMMAEYYRVMRANGRAILLVSELAPLKDAARTVGLRADRQVRVRILGQPAIISVWRKPA